MGSWGEKFFENDAAADLLEDFCDCIVSKEYKDCLALLIKYAQSSKLKQLLQAIEGSENACTITDYCEEEDIRYEFKELIISTSQILKNPPKTTEAKKLSHLLSIENTHFGNMHSLGEYEKLLSGKISFSKSYLDDFFTFNAFMHYKLNIMCVFPTQHVRAFILSLNEKYLEIEDWQDPKSRLKALQCDMVPVFVTLHSKYHKVLSELKKEICPLMLEQIYGHSSYAALEEKAILSQKIKVSLSRAETKFKI